MQQDRLKPSIDIDVFDRLGMNLYRSIETAISETIANAYDANATKVDIVVNSPSDFYILDNGDGIDENGFYKLMDIAKSHKSELKNNRSKMGRKGIGKLAPLFYAEYYDIFSIVNGKILGVRFTRYKKWMDKHSSQEEMYTYHEYTHDEKEHKKATSIFREHQIQNGTLVIPKEISKTLPFSNRKISLFVQDIKKRFCVPNEKNFLITLHAEKIHLEYKNMIMNGSLLNPIFPEDSVYIQRTGDVVNNSKIQEEILADELVLDSHKVKISGFVVTSPHLTKDNAPTFKIYSNGRLVSNVLPEEITSKRSIAASYGGGTIEMNDLSNEDKPDIIRDDRESIYWESKDERIVKLKEYLVNTIATSISKYNKNNKTKKNNELPEKNKTIIKTLEQLIKKTKDDDSISVEQRKPIIIQAQQLRKIAETFSPDNLTEGNALVISHNFSESRHTANFIEGVLEKCGISENTVIGNLLNTSSEKSGLNYGADFIKVLKNTIRNKKNVLVIFILTDGFFKNWFTPLEAGATLALGHQTEFVINSKKMPLMMPPFESSKTVPFMESVYTNDVLHTKYFIQMIEQVIQKFNATKLSRSQIKEKIDEQIRETNNHEWDSAKKIK